jgi:aconitate hydratase
MPYLEALGFHLAAFGCTTCIGNSGPLHPEIERTITENNLTVAAVLSGNRNFEARIHQSVKANFLASPMLVVAYALAGRMDIDLTMEPLGLDPNGEPVYLRIIWPAPRKSTPWSTARQAGLLRRGIRPHFRRRPVLAGPAGDRKHHLRLGPGLHLHQKPALLRRFQPDPRPQKPGYRARPSAAGRLGDHRPHLAGRRHPQGLPRRPPPDRKGVAADFNSYGSRRGNHEVMMRGTFANVRIKNKMVAPKEGGLTLKFPEKRDVQL